MEWSELDLENAIWTISAAKTKMRREHHVPLSRQAIEVIKHMKDLFGDKPEVFPSMMSGKTLLSENSMNSALRRIGVGSGEHTAHGFRSSASSILNESGKFSPDAIEAQLAHLDTREVRRIYNRATYWNERVQMMQWWADMLDEERTSPLSNAQTVQMS
ncbi:tyrosine-type recombinase/integrase [Rhizobium leguminosarum]|uniref:tyrosine-type recombinase/integrase n=1 Tax=Rhizobium leguminosarum TaxID=384 RepID=UPI001FDEF6E5|nr:site-specific integrase [Rhizobium leguminosarum]